MGLKDVFINILNKLKESTFFNTVIVYNKQPDRIRLGMNNFLMPGVFVEINPINILNLSSGLNAMDLDIIFHICNMEFDESDNLFDTNYDIINWRDKIHKIFEDYSPTNCGPMSYLNEDEDYNHDALYHYVYKFRCHFIDNSAYQENYLTPYELIWDSNGLIWDGTEVTWDAAIIPQVNISNNII